MTSFKNFFSFDDLRIYSNRLYINTAFTLIINASAAFLVINYSTKSMRFYKYYILLTVFTSFLMDFHTTAIYVPYPLFPIPAFCGAGPFSTFGYFWGECFHFYIMHFTLSFSGLSIFYGFAYQYFNVKQNCEFFHSKKGIIIMFLVMIIYPVPPVFLLSRVINRENVLDFVKKQFPEVFEFFTTASCNGVEFNEFTAFYLGLIIFQVILIFVLSLFLNFKAYNTLAKLRNTISVRTLQARKQFLYVLFLQLTLPFIFVVVPIVALLIAVIIKMDNIKEFSQIALQILSLHSCVNAILIIFVIKPYRQQLKRFLQNIFLCVTNKKVSPNPRTVVTHKEIIIPVTVLA